MCIRDRFYGYGERCFFWNSYADCICDGICFSNADRDGFDQCNCKFRLCSIFGYQFLFVQCWECILSFGKNQRCDGADLYKQ